MSIDFVFPKLNEPDPELPEPSEALYAPHLCPNDLLDAPPVKFTKGFDDSGNVPAPDTFESSQYTLSLYTPSSAEFVIKL